MHGPLPSICRSVYICIRAGDDDEEPMDDEDCIVIGITQEDSTVESLWQYTALPQVTCTLYSAVDPDPDPGPQGSALILF